MSKIDFDFLKDRDMGALLQDYLSLFKKIFKHYNKSILQFILPFVAIFAVVFYLASSRGTEFFYSPFKTETVILILLAIIVLTVFLYFIFIPTFGIEYMFLLEERRDTDFTGRDVWDRIKLNIPRYIKFFFASLLYLIIASIPLSIVAIFLFFVPIIGQIAVGFLGSIVGLVIFIALFIYLKEGQGIYDSFAGAFRLLRPRFMSYALGAYIFQTILSIIVGFIIFVPLLLLIVVGVGLGTIPDALITSFTAKILFAVGSALVIILYTLTSLYNASFYTLIYYSSLEASSSAGTLDRIDQIGTDNDELV